MRKRAGPVSEISLGSWQTDWKILIWTLHPTNRAEIISAAHVWNHKRRARIIPYEQNLKFVSLTGLARQADWLASLWMGPKLDNIFIMLDQHIHPHLWIDPLTLLVKQVLLMLFFDSSFNSIY